MVLMSAQSRQVVFIELKCPELEEAEERTRAKYAELGADCWRKGLKCPL